MTLAVLGDPQAVAAAGHAAARTGERVLLGLSAGDGHVHTRTTGLFEAGVDVRPVAEPDAEAYLLICTSAGLESVLAQHRDRLAGRPLLLAPGGFAGAIRVRTLFERWGLPIPLVGETSGFPVMGSAVGAEIMIRAVKRQLPVAGLDDEATAELLRVFTPSYGDLVGSDLVTTSLSNTNHMLHPAITVVNAARIARGEDFTFYRQGLAPELNALIEALDEERLAVVHALGGQALTVTEWLLRFYGTGPDAMRGDRIIDCLVGYRPFERSAAPTTLDHRYLTDDVPYGAAAHLAVSEALGLAAPVTRGIVTTASLLLGRDLTTPPQVVQEFFDRAVHRRELVPTDHRGAS
ncbi:MAG: NAD/NADP octopine/nopaline dehydrogenase family protein [Propionibacteriales bacterium]|nr:NAD/NADP octopine/nopaline dehydrogenase family protein [Propionibacteriales bacterium]